MISKEVFRAELESYSSEQNKVYSELVTALGGSVSWGYPFFEDILGVLAQRAKVYEVDDLFLALQDHKYDDASSFKASLEVIRCTDYTKTDAVKSQFRVWTSIFSRMVNQLADYVGQRTDFDTGMRLTSHFPQVLEELVGIREIPENAKLHVVKDFGKINEMRPATRVFT